MRNLGLPVGRRVTIVTWGDIREELFGKKPDKGCPKVPFYFIVIHREDVYRMTIPIHLSKPADPWGNGASRYIYGTYGLSRRSMRNQSVPILLKFDGHVKQIARPKPKQVAVLIIP
jgi:hypothetical protein